MKVLSTLKSAKQRAGCQVVKRKGRVFVICKENPRFKAVQGMKKEIALNHYHFIKQPLNVV